MTESAQSTAELTLGEVGELGVLRALRERFAGYGAPPPAGWLGIGDDAAALPAPAPGQRLLLTVDAVVEGVHFARAWAPARLVGRKAMAVNLSDIAAMGGTPTAALLALSLPRTLSLAWLLDFAQGAAERAAAHGCVIVGGNLTGGPVVSATITLVGEAAGERVSTRAGGAAGDVLYVTGRLGSAATGLRALLAAQAPVHVAAEHAAAPFDDDGRWTALGAAEELRACVLAQLDPVPRLAEGRFAAGFASAMIDVSDGLAGDLGHLARASGVAAEVETAQLPRWERVSAEEALWGGEDYQLCCAVPPARACDFERESAAGGFDFRRIGVLCPATAPDGSVVFARHADGRRERLGAGGFEHFR